jgi:outer membrane lipoprotein-sorting protein
MSATFHQPTPAQGGSGVRPLRRPATLFLLFITLISSTGCLVRSRERIQTYRPPTGWKETTLDALLDSLRAQETGIKTLNATVDVEPSVTSAQKGEVVHYRDVRSFLLIRRPGWLRMIGLYPVVRNTAFDLTSDGEKFELYVPSKDRLVIGSAASTKKSSTALENLRPHHILDALLWRSPDPAREKAALEVVDEPTMSHYVVEIFTEGGHGNLELARKVWFERAGLNVDRLQVYDAGGILATDARYSNYGEFNGVSYPQNIVIDRPQDQYGLSLRVTRLMLNEELGDEKFKMERPSNATVVNLDEQGASGNPPHAANPIKGSASN